MCTCPMPVTHQFQDWKYTEIVPCGKCHECLAKLQNEFAALSVLESKKHDTMWFCAFTYSNLTCPIMVSRVDDSGELLRDDIGDVVEQYFLPDSERWKYVPLMTRERYDRGRLIKYLVPYQEGALMFQPSLRREEVRLFLKRTRQAYKRKFGYLPDFRYGSFGEYGDQFHRPHTHFMLFGLSAQEMAFFKSAWQDQFGYMDVCEIPFFNPDGSPARVKVSKYVAKYLRKPKKDFEPLLRGFVESPRLCCSKGYGKGVLPESLKDFYLAKDLESSDPFVRYAEIVRRRKSLIIDGVKYPLPRRLSEDYFRVPIKSKIRENVSQKTGEIAQQVIRQTARSTLSIQVSNFARDRYSASVIERIRSYSKVHNDEAVDRLLTQIAMDEKLSLQDRAIRARQIYLQHLKNQKYG